MCVDANAGIRAQARQEKLKKDALYKQEALKFFNKETTLERRQDANVIGYSRDLSDAYAKAVAEVGQGRKQVEDATRAYLSTIPVDEGGRSRRFGNKNLQLYLSKRAEVDLSLIHI